MKRIMTLLSIFIIVLFAGLSISCEKTEPLPKIFIGEWGFDTSSFENDPKLKQMKEDPKGKEAFDVIAKAFASLSVSISESTFYLDMPGSASGKSGSTNMKFAYKVTGATEGEATIVNKDQGPAGGRYRLQVLDSNHIKMINIINENQPMEMTLVRMR